MANVVSRAKIHASKSTFEEKCARALVSDCAHELAVILGSISMEKERQDEKRSLFQQVLERKTNVGPVAMQCLFHLGTFGPEAHRKAVQTIIDRGYDADTDHIYAGAISSMLKLPDVNAGDMRILATALHGSSRDLRASTLQALRSLSADRLQELSALNQENIATCAPFARALDTKLTDTRIEIEVIEATVVRQMNGASR